VKNYLLTIKIPFQAADDMAARYRIVTDILRGLNYTLSFEESGHAKHETKLQEIFDNKPPRKVEL